MATSDETDDELHQLERELSGEDLRDAIRALLEPDEHMRELADVNVAYGDSDWVPDLERFPRDRSRTFDRLWAFCTRTRLRKILFSILFAPVVIYLALDSMGSSNWLDRLIGGRTCDGAKGSTAHQIAQALSILGGGRARLLVISDRRLLFVGGDLLARPPQPTIVHAVPPGSVAAARRRPRGVLRRRVELRFTDGSRIVLGLSTFPVRSFSRGGLNTSPKRVVAALGFGQS